ncbi:MAG: cytochrome-c peroxidase [Polyangiales bacterium]|nr:cytochrome-c peroxidase [Myxococcales bacterium]MCB9662160.1 cytochrome-c peroxidase [Sandaracinaceae bacterium]
MSGTLRRSLLATAVALSTTALLVACGGSEPEETPTPTPSPEPAPAATATSLTSHAPLAALPPAPEVPAPKLELGRRLYHDTALSGDGTVACVTCHSFDHGGAENRRTSEGIRGQIGPINSPTVLNASLAIRQFWDGRAADLAEQAAGPVANPVEMGATWDDVVARLGGDPSYVAAFTAAGYDGVSQANITDAIAAFESTLLTPGPFDRFIGGDHSALNEQQQRGYMTFREVGCIACHNGPALGGQSFQKMGAVQDYFALRGGEVTEADLGRFNFTHEEGDRHFFKVPTLRNVAQTAPYFHDGSQAELAGAVRIMGQVQLGRELTDAQVEDIVAFLRALDGELPAHARMPATAAEAPAAE